MVFWSGFSEKVWKSRPNVSGIAGIPSKFDSLWVLRKDLTVHGDCKEARSSFLSRPVFESSGCSFADDVAPVCTG